LPASFLKHADEQTVAGLAAVFKAVHVGELQTTDFSDWGVLAAPRFLGRPAMAAALQRFKAEGAWGVSPHLIPHRSLHSISGTVSQALKIHGPNFGIGGGHGAAAEALLAATAMLEGQKLPGVWVVLTCLDPEQPPDVNGLPAAGTQCVGLALALTPLRGTRCRLRLRIVCGMPEVGVRNATTGLEGGLDLLRLEVLLSLARSGRNGETTAAPLLDSGSRIELLRTRIADGLERAPLQATDSGMSPDSDRGQFVLADC
jgi:hypothetical protein